jgi:WD40 repeat protein
MPVLKKEVVITVHGIRTFGDWQTRLKKLLRAANPELIVENYGYGYFNALAFIIPFFRWRAVRDFQCRLRDLLHQHSDANISIVAHSFGTHIVSWGLKGLETHEMPYVRVLILSGSVLKSNFDWNLLLKTKRIGCVINDCGINDGILILSQLFVLFTGMAGRIGFYGFTNERLLNRFFVGGHSHYFQPAGADPDAFMREWWVPQLAYSRPAEEHDARRAKGPLQGFAYSILPMADAVKLLVYGSFSLAIYQWAYQGPRDEARFETDRMLAREAADLLASGRVSEASRKALNVLKRRGPLIPQSYDVLYTALFNPSVRPKRIEVGNFNTRVLVTLSRERDVLFLTDNGSLSIWSIEGASRFRDEGPELMFEGILTADHSALFINDSRSEEIRRFDLKSKVTTTFDYLLLDSELKPPIQIAAIDDTTLIGCRDKTLVKYAASAHQETEGLKVSWRKTVDLEGECTSIFFHSRSRSVAIGTSAAEVAIFNLDTDAIVKVVGAGVLGWRFGIERLMITENHVLASSLIEGYVLKGRVGKDVYRFQSIGNFPIFSGDGRFLISGWNGETSKREFVVIKSLSANNISRHPLNCLCKFVAFVDKTQFITLDDNKILTLRNLPNGDIASQLYIFEQRVDNAFYFSNESLVVGIQTNGEAYLAKIGQRSNFVSLGFKEPGLISKAIWLSNELVLLEFLQGTADFARVILKIARTGAETVWSMRSDGQKRRDDQWYEVVKMALEKAGTDQRLDEADRSAGKQLPGVPLNIEISGYRDIVARQTSEGIIFVDKVLGNVLFKIDRPGSQISSIWISRDKSKLAAGSQDGTLRFWDKRIGEVPIAQLNAHGSEITKLIANPSESLLISSDWRGHARVWPLLTREQLISETERGDPGLRDSLATWLRWILGWVTPPISPASGR